MSEFIIVNVVFEILEEVLKEEEIILLDYFFLVLCGMEDLI